MILDSGNFLRCFSYKESNRFQNNEYGAGTEITVPETELEKEVTVDGINITGMSRDEAKAAILKDFPWGMKVTWQDQSYDVNDLMAEKVDSLLQEIYTGEPKESYTLDTTGLEDAAAPEAETVAGASGTRRQRMVLFPSTMLLLTSSYSREQRKRTGCRSGPVKG